MTPIYDELLSAQQARVSPTPLPVVLARSVPSWSRVLVLSCAAVVVFAGGLALIGALA